MGGRVGDGGTLLDSSGRPIGPSGRLQVFEPTDFPYLHTGKSLVFTIARNGHVWGKRLDEQSSKGDVELEIFWPVESGCFLAINDKPDDVLGARLPLKGFPYVLSRSQKDKIQSILSQKERIRYELGTLMTVVGVRISIGYVRASLETKLLQFQSTPCSVKVVDCMSLDSSAKISNRSHWGMSYDESSFDFLFSPQVSMISVAKGEANASDVKINSRVGTVKNWRTEDLNFYAARAVNGRFDVSGWEPCTEQNLFRPELRIMYGEHDFFEYFVVDDAALLLERRQNNELFWTLAIAQNRHVREMIRLASNNPDLFKPLIPKVYREGGKKL